MMNKHIKTFVIFLIGMAIGNRVFNHIDAWLGVIIVTATIIFFIYKSIKTLKNEKKD